MDSSQSCLPVTSLGLLKAYGNRVKRLNPEEHNEKSSDAPSKISSCGTLSTNDIMKLARARLLQLNMQNADVFSIMASCFRAQSGLPSEVSEDLELAMLLQAAAEKVASRKFVDARKLLSMCNHSASINGNPVQRIVYYFAEALNERINREWGIPSPQLMKLGITKPIDVEQTQISLQIPMIERQKQFSISLVSQFTGIQSLLDSVASAKRLHLIDFRIKNGSHWTILMQALAIRYECPLELLKITAVGTSKEMMEETGRRLSSFAETMKLSFSFNVVVSELRDLKEDLFKLEPDETLAVYASICLFGVLVWPSHLESVIKVIKNLRPCVLVFNELEVSTNSPIFMERFTEALYYLSAVFDFLNACSKDPYRQIMEEVYLREKIRIIVTIEGSEGIHRNEKLSFWRALFSRYGIVETELSPSALCQASLLLKSSGFGSSCTLDMDGKCMILGWRGTPLESVSAWKVQHD